MGCATSDPDRRWPAAVVLLMLPMRRTKSTSSNKLLRSTKNSRRFSLSSELLKKISSLSLKRATKILRAVIRSSRARGRLSCRVTN